MVVRPDITALLVGFLVAFSSPASGDPRRTPHGGQLQALTSPALVPPAATFRAPRLRPPCAVGQAFRHVGKPTREIAAFLGIDQWRADAYPDRMCACFVSGAMRAAGCTVVDPNLTVYPVDIERALLGAGWRYVPAAQARHGDVALFDLPGSVLGHVELVARRDARTITLIGSNNLHGLASPQTVSLDRRPMAECQLMRFLAPPLR